MLARASASNENEEEELWEGAGTSDAEEEDEGTRVERTDLEVQATAQLRRCYGKSLLPVKLLNKDQITHRVKWYYKESREVFWKGPVDDVTADIDFLAHIRNDPVQWAVGKKTRASNTTSGAKEFAKEMQVVAAMAGPPEFNDEKAGLPEFNDEKALTSRIGYVWFRNGAWVAREKKLYEWGEEWERLFSPLASFSANRSCLSHSSGTAFSPPSAISTDLLPLFNATVQATLSGMREHCLPGPLRGSMDRLNLLNSAIRALCCCGVVP